MDAQRERGLERERLERLFKATFEQAAVGMAHVAPDGSWLRVNDRLSRIVGYPCEELLGMRFQDLTYPPDREAEVELSERLLAGELETYSLEKRCVRKDGSLVWVETTVSLVREDGERPSLSVVVVEDISDRKAAEEALRESEWKYRLLFEHANDQVAVYRVQWDERGDAVDAVIEDVNPSWTQSIGIPRDRAVGMTLSMLYGDPRVMGPYVDFVRRVMRGQESARFELYFEPVKRHYLVSVFPLDRDRFVGAATDITELREAEEKLKRQADSIREAYVDVLDAVTGGRLVLMTPRELVDALGEPVSARVDIHSAEELGDARQGLRGVLAEAFPDLTDGDDVLAAFGEATTNALKHAGRGWYQVFRDGDRVQVLVGDHGPGIDFRHLPKAARGSGFSTTQTLGLGFTMMLQLCGRVLLSTQPGYTAVVLEVVAAGAGRCEAPGHPGRRVPCAEPEVRAPDTAEAVR